MFDAFNRIERLMDKMYEHDFLWSVIAEAEGENDVGEGDEEEEDTGGFKVVGVVVR